MHNNQPTAMPKRITPAIAQLQARITALELLLQQLIFLQEVEPACSAEKMAAWLKVCHSRQKAAQTEDPRALAALDRLIGLVLQ